MEILLQMYKNQCTIDAALFARIKDYNSFLGYKANTRIIHDYYVQSCPPYCVRGENRCKEGG